MDFIVFDGMCDGEVKQIAFVEAKTGKTGQLNKKEKQVRDVVVSKNVLWDKLHYKGNQTH
ncbi:MAG: Holliday junction resolvase-like protein [Archaeoglobaceae archaeon]